MIRHQRPALILFTILILPAMVISGCGGSSNRTPTDTVTCMSFVPTQGPAAGFVAAEVDASSTCETLVLNMMVTEVDDLWSAGATVRFPINLMNFVGVSSSGSVLNEGGIDVVVSGDRPCPEGGTDWCQPLGQFYGEVSIGITRSSGVASGVDVGAASQRLLQLSFTKAFGNGTTTLSFPSGTNLFDGQRPPQAILPAPAWVGGTVTVN